MREPPIAQYVGRYIAVLHSLYLLLQAHTLVPRPFGIQVQTFRVSE
jgi:hypothetical protein